MPIATGTTIGPYEITGWIGAGGMGEVYRARDPRLGRDVALKVISEGLAADAGRVQRFEQEARAAGQLNHPNILAVHDTGISQGRPFIVSELLEGSSLRDRLRSGPLPLRKAIDYARQIAEGLAAAHGKAIVHRDLKPDNIFLTNDGRIKILDFGLAKLTQAGDQATVTAVGQDTEPGTILGTAGYMSPEQVRGEVVDARSDLFSFGTIFYEMIVGRSPFARSTAVETMAAILHHHPEPVSTMPPGIERILARCLEKPREARFQSARDLAFGLEFLSSNSLTGEPADGAAPRSWRRLWPAAALAGVAAIGVALAFAPALAPAPAPLLPVRMSIDLGAGTLLGPTQSQFGGVAALSRDGSLLVFSAQRSQEDAMSVLYVRTLSELEARPLAGTEGGHLPFLSPDGRWIGFFRRDKLMKIATAGGPPQELADVSDPRGGWWSDDGMIVYTPDRVAGTPLWRVPADGGTAAPLTTLAGSEQVHTFPQVLPGGRGVVYTGTETPSVYGDSSIHVLPPSGPAKVIHKGGFYGRVTASGHLVFVQDGTLMAAPIDLDRFELTRAPAPVILGVRSNGLTGGAQFTVSESGVLVYLPGPSVGGNTPMQLMDQQSTYTPLNQNFRNWLDVRFSPDGGRLAVGIRDRTADIWTYDLARETLMRLTTDEAANIRPVWSPDGRRIVFASRSGTEPTTLAWRAADGSGATQTLLESDRHHVPMSIHPDGNLIAYEEFATEANIDLKALPIDASWKAGTPITIAAGRAREYDAAFSPDGRWVAFTSEESGRPEVYAMSFPALDAKVQISNDSGRTPTWSRARQEILWSGNGYVMAASYTTDGKRLRVEKPRRWAEGRLAFRGIARTYDLHPDGTRVVLAPAPPPQMDSTRQDKAVVVFNFFEELRRITSSQ